METTVSERWGCGANVNWLHLSVGIKLELPRNTKHTHVRWAVKLRLLFWGVYLTRKNEKRIAKNKPAAAEVVS